MLPSRFYEDMLEEFNNNKNMNCDIYEQNGVYNIEMDLPGFKKDEIKIECHKGTIIISAKKIFNKEDHEGKKYLRRERHFGKLERSFYLGDIAEDEIKAEYKDGTLIVKVPQRQETAKKLITIE